MSVQFTAKHVTTQRAVPEVFVLSVEADFEGIQYILSVHKTEKSAEEAMAVEVKARRHRKRDLDISRAPYFS